MNQHAPTVRRPATYQDVLDGTRAVDLTDKRRIYAAAGVSMLWFADPIGRTLEAFALREGAWTLTVALKDDDEARVAPFDAIAFPMSVLWPD